MADGEKIVVTGPFSATECGVYESRVEYNISNASSVDVTDMYESTSEYGRVEIIKNSLWISTESASRPYDGSPLINESWEMSGSLMSGDSIEVRFNSAITNVGVIRNVPQISIVDGRGADVTRRYDITVQPCQLEVTPLQITVQTGTATKIYDGLPLKQTSWTLVSGDLVASHYMEAISYSAMTDVGTVPNEVYFAIRDAGGVEVTSNYKIKFIDGTLTVQPRPITIRTGSASGSYNGADLSSNEFFVVSGNLCSGHTATMVGAILSGIGYTKNIPQSFKIMETVSGNVVDL